VFPFELSFHIVDRQPGGPMHRRGGLVTDQVSSQRSKPKTEVDLDPLRPFELGEANLGDRTRVVNQATIEHL